MSGQRWDVSGIREYVDGQGVTKSRFFRIGTGFTNRDGSINLLLEAVPAGAGPDGQVKMILQIPLEPNGPGGGGRQQNFQGPRGQQRPPAQQGGGNRQRYRGQGQPQRMQAPPPAYEPAPADPDAPPGGGGDDFDYQGADSGGQDPEIPFVVDMTRRGWGRP